VATAALTLAAAAFSVADSDSSKRHLDMKWKKVRAIKKYLPLTLSYADKE